MKFLFFILYVAFISVCNAQQPCVLSFDINQPTAKTEHKSFAVKPATIPFDSIAEKPKITLYYMFGTASPKIKGFMVDDLGVRKFGFMHKTLKAYIKNDPEALKNFNTHKQFYLATTFLRVFGVASFAPVFYLNAKSLNNGNSSIGSRIVFLSIPVFIFASSFIFDASSNIYLRKTVKVYNKNAGYGYFDGLESFDSK